MNERDVRPGSPANPGRRRWLAGVSGAALVGTLGASSVAAAPTGCAAANPWALWQRFASRYMQSDGRVVDDSVPQKHSTSESQAYAMVFALVANDPDAFARAWRWTVDNLAGGDIAARLPAWKWGRREDGGWGVIDPNAAADADLWLAYALFEAARLWKKPRHRKEALALLARVQREEVADLPGFGPMLLPGPQGFALPERVWRLNPSYLPLPLLRRLAHEDAKGPWNALAANTQRLLQGASANGFVADWVGYQAVPIGEGRFVADPVKGDVGSYDAIRCYLWAGMTPADDPLYEACLQPLGGMRQALQASGGLPPEKVAVLTGQTSGTGSSGFSAALLPYLRALGDEALYRGQLSRVREALASSTKTGELPVYYDMVLSLFALGWVEGRYRFQSDGRLALPWCTA